jgi:hypothetical protein
MNTTTDTTRPGTATEDVDALRVCAIVDELEEITKRRGWMGVMRVHADLGDSTGIYGFTYLSMPDHIPQIISAGDHGLQLMQAAKILCSR